MAEAGGLLRENHNALYREILSQKKKKFRDGVKPA